MSSLKKTKIIIILIFLFIFTSMFSFAQPDIQLENLIGSWEGSASIAGMKLRVIFNLTADTSGNIRATMDSPDQGVNDIPIEKVTLKNQQLDLEIKALKGTFEGIVKEDLSTITGKIYQSGQSFPVVLKRLKQSIKINRPQEPQRPYPYIEEEVTYKNKEAGIQLAGTLTLPGSEGPFPAVILISGSGTQDRDETILNHKPFLVLSDYLTRLGIAVLRVDDRGIGGSTGGSPNDTSEDFAGDVLSGLEFLKNRKEIDLNQIGLIGHSEGGIIAPMVAAENTEIAFIVLLGGTGLSGEEVIYLQAEMLSRVNGASDELVELGRKLQEKLFNILRVEKDNILAEKKIRETIENVLVNLTISEKQSLNFTENNIESQIKIMLSPWYRNFLFYNPRIALSKLSCPVLAIIGEKDLQVAAEENLKSIEEALKEGNNKDYKVIEIPNLNHLLQTAVTGSPSEYGKIEETISPEVLQLVGKWILQKSEK